MGARAANFRWWPDRITATSFYFLTMARRPKSAQDRVRLREELFQNSKDRIWPDRDGAGWFKCPRTLPVVLMFLDHNKDLRGAIDVTRTYLTLFAENRDEGLVIITDEDEYARLSGFNGGRAVRSWRERMTKLASLGFIETRSRGDREFGYVLLVHPWLVAQKLRSEGKVSDGDWGVFLEKHMKHAASEPSTQIQSEPKE